MSSIGLMVLIIAIGGAIGGAVNAFMTENGFILPKREQVADGSGVLRPGALGNIFIGMIAAVVSWGLYGPLSSYVIFGTAAARARNVGLDEIGVSLASSVGAILVGIGGAKWLTNEVDKNLLKAAASEAARKGQSAEAANEIARSTPAGALKAAREMTG